MPCVRSAVPGAAGTQHLAGLGGKRKRRRMAGLPPGTDAKGMGEREELAWCQGRGWRRSCACVRLGKGGRGGRMELG